MWFGNRSFQIQNGVPARLLGGATALLKVSCSKTYELCAREVRAHFCVRARVPTTQIPRRLTDPCIIHTMCALGRPCEIQASQILGGASYTRGGKGQTLERLYREVRSMAIPGGSEEIMMDLAMKQARL